MRFNYKNRIVGFIDVLGFKHLVSSDKRAIQNYYAFIFENFKSKTKQSALQYTLISDSIIIYCSPTNANFKLVIRAATQLQSDLLTIGILIRGGISFGELYIQKQKNIIVGNGLIKAYQLESKAKYPRIIIDRELSFFFYNGINQMISELKTPRGFSFIKMNPPSSYILDYPYLNYGAVFSQYYTWTRFKSFFTFFKENYYGNQNIEKYEWLKMHLIESITNNIEYYEGLPNLTGKYRNRYNYYKRQLSLFAEL